jgi:Tfp pilus assembly protein FimT
MCQASVNGGATLVLLAAVPMLAPFAAPVLVQWWRRQALLRCRTVIKRKTTTTM